jgi:hypothetical protein
MHKLLAVALGLVLFSPLDELALVFMAGLAVRWFRK